MDFVTHYQGIHLLRPCGGYSLYGHEALLRDPHERPGAFFANARRAGRLAELDIQAFRLNCRTFADHDPGGILFVNFFPETFCSPEFTATDMLNFLHKIGLAPSRIVLELIENWPALDLGEIQRTLALLAKEGVQFALDDLRGSIEDMERWHELQPDLIKFDRSLVQGIAVDQRRQQTLLALESTADDTNTQLLCEGVETMADADWLRDNTDILLYQGFYFSRPAPIFAAAATPQSPNEADVLHREKACA